MRAIVRAFARAAAAPPLLACACRPLLTTARTIASPSRGARRTSRRFAPLRALVALPSVASLLRRAPPPLCARWSRGRLPFLRESHPAAAACIVLAVSLYKLVCVGCRRLPHPVLVLSRAFYAPFGRRGDYKPCRVQNGASFCIIGAPPRLPAASPPYKIAVLYNRPSGRARLSPVAPAAAAAVVAVWRVGGGSVWCRACLRGARARLCSAPARGGGFFLVLPLGRCRWSACAPFGQCRHSVSAHFGRCRWSACDLCRATGRVAPSRPRTPSAAVGVSRSRARPPPAASGRARCGALCLRWDTRVSAGHPCVRLVDSR